MLKREKGFTLIELMIVVAIIGILAAIAIPKFVELLCKSKDGAMAGDLGALRSALVGYYAHEETYPDSVNLKNYLNNAGIMSTLRFPKCKAGVIDRDKLAAASDAVIYWQDGQPVSGQTGWAYDSIDGIIIPNFGAAMAMECTGKKPYSMY